VLAVAAVLALAVVGYLVGTATQSEPAPPVGTRTVAAEDLSVRTPGNWRTVTPPAVPGLPLVRAAAAEPPDGGGAVVFGISDGTGPTLLPGSFRDRLESAPKPDDAVRLGSLPAYRYAGLRPKGAPGAVDVFASPAKSGVITVACVDGLPRAACEQVAARLTADRSLRPVGLGPRADYAKRVSAVVGELTRARGKAQKALRKAGKRKAQAKAAKAVAAAYKRAADALGRVGATPLEREAAPAVVRSFRDAAAAYRALSGAARAGKVRAYRSSSKAAAAADRRATDAVKRLGTLGYKVG
jgi:hypothetical protein